MASRDDRQTVAQLRDRWDAARQKEINRALEKHGQPDRSTLGLDLVDGRTDLRGCEIGVVLERRHLADIDFSHTVWELPAQLLFCEVRNCVFDHAKGGAALDRKFSGCSFRSAKLSRVIFRGAFEDCAFDGATIRDAKANGARFVRCSFRRANLTRAHLLRCTFEECDFSEAYFGEGSLSGSILERCSIDRTALATTLMERVVWR